MKHLIRTILFVVISFCIGLGSIYMDVYAYDTVEEIDSLKLRDHINKLMPSACNYDFSGEGPTKYEQLVIKDVNFFNCNSQLVRRLKECAIVPQPSCKKPTMDFLVIEFDKLKTKFKARLTLRENRKTLRPRFRAIDNVRNSRYAKPPIWDNQFAIDKDKIVKDLDMVLLADYEGKATIHKVLVDAGKVKFDERKALREKLKTEDLTLEEINKIMR